MAEVTKAGVMPSGFHITDSPSVQSSPTAPLAVADFCTVAWLGRDFDLTFYAMKAFVKSFSGFREGAVGPATIEAEASYLETARIRLGTPAVIHVIGNLLANLKEADSDTFYSLIENIRPMFDEPAADDEVTR